MSGPRTDFFFHFFFSQIPSEATARTGRPSHSANVQGEEGSKEERGVVFEIWRRALLGRDSGRQRWTASLSTRRSWCCQREYMRYAALAAAPRGNTRKI
jgi:hypothetical protein